MTGAIRPATASAPRLPAPAPRTRWERGALVALLVVTAIAYCWNLPLNDFGNAFYAAAAQAGGLDWQAFLFGSSDPSNAITVDKPPAALWLPALFVRLFGLSPWTVLLPQALMGVAAVWLTWVIVRRHWSPASALIAAAILAFTPVSVEMFRFNNPEALLTLLTLAAIWATARLIETPRLGWALAVGGFVGLAFLTKQAQALLIVPVLAGVYLWAAPVGWGRRMLHLVAALAAMVVSAGWWVLVVTLVPSGERPFIGGSDGDSFLELTFGHNGLGRITGGKWAFDGNAPIVSGGAPGPFRLLGESFGVEIGWIVFPALILGIGALLLLRRRPRTDPGRALLIVAVLGALFYAAVFSGMQGLVHPYYVAVLVPWLAIAAGCALPPLWAARAGRARWILVGALAAGAVSSAVVLGWSAAPIVGLVAAAVGAAGTVLLVLERSRTGLVAAIATTASIALLVPMLATSVLTIARPHTGAIPRAGFASAPIEGVGGELDRGAASDAVAAFIAARFAPADGMRWAAATIGSNNAATYQLTTGLPVMAIGGYDSTDPAPTLELFQQRVAAGEIGVFYLGGDVFDNRPGMESSRIRTWVVTHYEGRLIDGYRVFDLTGPQLAG